MPPWLKRLRPLRGIRPGGRRLELRWWGIRISGREDVEWVPVPCGKLTVCYGKSQFLMGKSTISIAMLVYKRVTKWRFPIMGVPPNHPSHEWPFQYWNHLKPMVLGIFHAKNPPNKQPLLVMPHDAKNRSHDVYKLTFIGHHWNHWLTFCCPYPGTPVDWNQTYCGNISWHSPTVTFKNQLKFGEFQQIGNPTIIQKNVR